MANSIISDEINAGRFIYKGSTLNDSSWASLHFIKCQQMYSISYIEEHVISCKYKRIYI